MSDSASILSRQVLYETDNEFLVGLNVAEESREAKWAFTIKDSISSMIGIDRTILSSNDKMSILFSCVRSKGVWSKIFPVGYHPDDVLQYLSRYIRDIPASCFNRLLLPAIYKYGCNDERNLQQWTLEILADIKDCARKVSLRKVQL